MSAPRFFVDPALAALAEVQELDLPDAVGRHATQVLRLRDGDAIVLFDGSGGEYPATLSVQGRRAAAHLGAHVDVERESASAVALVQSIVAPDIMDWIVRKAVELGAAAIAPIRSARSQGLSAEREERRAGHWRQIVVAACEQCGRNRLPGVSAVASFDAWLAAAQPVRNTVILDAGARRSLAAHAAVSPARFVVIGPEGGFTDDELARAEAAGATRVHAGPRVLRAETAALVALATLNALAGDAR